MTPCGDMLEGHWWGKILLVERTSSTVSDCWFCMKGKMNRCAMICWLMDSEQWFIWIVRGNIHGKNTIGRLVTRKTGEEACRFFFAHSILLRMDKNVDKMWSGYFEWTKVWRCLFPIHQWPTSTEEDFNNQVKSLTSQWIWTCLFPQPLLSSPGGPLNKVAKIAEIEIKHRLSHMDCPSPRLNWLWSLLETQSTSYKDQHWDPHMMPFPRVISQLPGGKFITLDPFHPKTGSILFLIKEDMNLFSLNRVFLATLLSEITDSLWYLMLHYFW